MDAEAATEPPEQWAGAVILAAGRGVRMRSSLPKVLHAVGGVPMILRVLRAVHDAGIERVVVVVDQADGAIARALPPNVSVGIQATPGGTGDAVAIGLQALGDTPGRVVVVGGDTPLLTSETVQGVLSMVNGDGRQVIALACATRDDPHGYGRVLLTADSRVERIVEEADATPDERDVQLVNGMIFAFDGPWLARKLPNVTPAANGELYLTALVGMATGGGDVVQAVRCDSHHEVMGVNTRRELAQAEQAWRTRTLDRLFDAGVTIVDPSAIYVEDSVQVGQDVVLHPQTYLRGNTVIGDGCVLGPGAEIIDSRLAAETRVWWSVVEGAEVGSRVRIGPYCRVRPDTTLGDAVALGSFAEVKASQVGAGTQMHHFSYMGDTETGANVNIGAGAVTCNFDGELKHRTVIGDGAFIGSDTMLIAPVRVGDGAATGAGAVVTRDVPDGGLVVGAPARPIERRRRPPPDPETTA